MFLSFKRQYLSPLSCSQSGDDAPLHSLRGPSTGDTCSRPSRDPEPGRGRSSGDRDGGEEDEWRWGADEEENEQRRSTGADVEVRLQVDCVSGSSSDVLSSMLTEITAAQNKHNPSVSLLQHATHL